MRTQSDTTALKIGRIARRQHGVVTRAQLLDAGLPSGQIGRRVRSGALLVEHPGVYRVGHRAPSVEARYLAAVLAGGADARLTGPAAAWALRILKGGAPPPEITAPVGRRLHGVRCHRGRIDPEDRATWRGIPTTTPARTLTDLASCLPLDALARACHEAGVLHRTTPGHVRAVLARKPNTPGAAALMAVMSGDERVSLSALESRFLDVLRHERLPLPRTNKVATGRRVDCKWPALTVELDSFRFHNSRHTWEQDRRREREAYARGDHFRRYTWGDVFEHPRQMLAELHALLPLRQPTGAPAPAVRP